MAIPSVTDFENAKIDVDDLAEIVNGDDTVTTRTGGAKLSVSQALSQIIVGEVTVYSASSTYTDIEDWVEYSGAIYRPLPSQLPIGPEPFNPSKWAVVQGVISGGIPNETTASVLIASSDYGASPANTVVEVLGFSAAGDGGAAQWRKTGVTGLTASQTPAQLGDAKLTDANGHEWAFVGNTIDPLQLGASTSGDNLAVINVALVYASSVGGSVVSTGGTYEISAALSAQSGCDWIGQGGIIKLQDSSDTSMLTGSGVSNFTIDGVVFDGNDSNQTTENACIEFLSSDSATQFENVNVYRCRIYSIKGGGIYIRGGKRCKVAHNDIKDCEGAGVQISSDSTADSERCTVTSNTIENVKAAGVIAMGDSQYNLVSNNTIQDWNSDDYNASGVSNGDGVTGYDIENEHLTVTGNVIINTGKSTGGHGIHLGGNYCVASSNSIRNPPSSGIYIRSESSNVESPVVSGNSIFDGNSGSTTEQGGIFVRLCNSPSVTGNTIDQAPYDGIIIDGCGGFSVTGNTVRNPSDNGIFLGDGFGGSNQSTRGVVSGNNIFSPDGDGIQADIVVQTLISGNFIFDGDSGGGKAIQITANAAYVIGSGNYSRDGGTSDAYDIDVSANNCFLENNFQTNSTSIVGTRNVASASTIDLTTSYRVFSITGTSAISTITGTYPGRVVTLKFNATASLNDGAGNLILAGAFSGTADDTITLACLDGTNWTEVSRSVN